MGKIFKIILAIVLFPIAIFYYLLKFVYNRLSKKIAKKYISGLTKEKIDGLDGEEFEDLLAIYFKGVGLGVTKTKKSHDYGADLIVKHKKDSIAIQCKLYYKHSVGNSAVQEISTAREFYGADRAMVITNSKFTRPSEILAGTIGVQLIDGEKLMKMLSIDNKKELLKFLSF